MAKREKDKSRQHVLVTPGYPEASDRFQSLPGSLTWDLTTAQWVLVPWDPLPVVWVFLVFCAHRRLKSFCRDKA